MRIAKPDAVLFDLDGTLADTAPDLGEAANRLRQRHDLAPLSLTSLRPYTSHGVRGMLQAAFDLSPDDPRYTDPLIAALSLHERACCVISGDSAARPKPAPDPLLLACERASLTPARCIYVGDDLRDIEAGRAAGMATVAAAYGYLGNDCPVEQWQADAIIRSPAELLLLMGITAW